MTVCGSAAVNIEKDKNIKMFWVNKGVHLLLFSSKAILSKYYIWGIFRFTFIYIFLVQHISFLVLYKVLANCDFPPGVPEKVSKIIK